MIWTESHNHNVVLSQGRNNIITPRQGVQLVCSIRPDTSGPCRGDIGALWW